MAGIKVLMVVDGERFNFGPAQGNVSNADYFGISALTGALKANPQIQLDTAHRRGATFAGQDPDTSVGLTYPGDFLFTGIDLTQYDVLWLIGDEGLNGTLASTTADSEITGAEKIALAKYMEGGGGVFAIGDHDGVGALMLGRLPRIRVMRRWFEWDHIETDAASGQVFMPNWSVGADKAKPVIPEQTDRNDTLQPDADGTKKFYFFDQSDQLPQTLTTKNGTALTASPDPVHPIMIDSHGNIIGRFPDHMHEGEATDFASISKAGPGTPFNPNDGMGNPRQIAIDDGMGNISHFTEFRKVAGVQAVPQVIAWGQDSGHETIFFTVTYAKTNPKTAGKVAIYDGRQVGVGRIVTGSTFHHYIDKNIIGDPMTQGMGGAPTNSNLGLPSDVKDGMADYFRNVVAWLARPPRVLSFAIDKSTFGKDEVQAHMGGVFEAALFVIVDGMKPSDFPGGPINENIDTPTPSQLVKLANWAPKIPAPGGTNMVFTPTGVSSDDPTLPDRIQRFTFTYRVTFPDVSAFGFGGGFEVLDIIASLAATPAPPDAVAQIELITDADPYFSNLANGNKTSWLSSDLRVFKVIQDEAPFGKPLGSSQSDARDFIVHAIQNVTNAQFEAIAKDEEASALSFFPMTMPLPPLFLPKPVYNFALARVRLNGIALPANPTRVFFRLVQSPTTSALTYQVDMSDKPILGYRQAESGGVGGHKIALLGISGDNKDYTTVPCFAAERAKNSMLGDNMTTQKDPHNSQSLNPIGSERTFFFGAWLDTNQPSPLLFPDSPMGQANTDGPFSGGLNPIMTAVLKGVHQCLVAEIVFDGAPIIPNATPASSDKLAQRNIAFTVVANPGTPGSRTATHTFEIRPSPVALDAAHRPDELMIDWRNLPDGTTAAIYLPAVAADDVIAMADKMYARHGLKKLDAHTIESPVGGITYLPIPKGGVADYAGLFSLDLPAGIVKGERYDVIVRQITSAGFQTAAAATTPAKTGAKKTQARLAKARSSLKRLAPNLNWQKTYGAFQIAVPVSTKADMLVEEERTLSVLRWIGQSISANSRWYPVFQRYLDTMAGRVLGLGGDPDTIPPTPDGLWPALIARTALLGAPASGGSTSGAAPGGHHPHRGHGITGKIDAIVFDHFGDFEGFVLETEGGDFHRYDSREPRVLALVRRAWEERITVTVHATPQRPHRPLEIVLHGAGPGRP